MQTGKTIIKTEKTKARKEPNKKVQKWVRNSNKRNFDNKS